MKTSLSDDILEHSIPGRVIQRARLQPDAVALRHKQLGIWGEITWSGYADNIAATARAFWEIGVRPGDHVAIMSDNRPQ